MRCTARKLSCGFNVAACFFALMVLPLAKACFATFSSSAFFRTSSNKSSTRVTFQLQQVNVTAAVCKRNCRPDLPRRDLLVQPGWPAHCRTRRCPPIRAAPCRAPAPRAIANVGWFSAATSSSREPRFRSVNDSDGQSARYAFAHRVESPLAEHRAQAGKILATWLENRRNQYCRL